MKKFSKTLLCALMALALVICIPAKARAAALPSGTEFGEIGAEIEKYVAEHESTTAGMGVSVFSGDETVYTGYFGCADKENGIAVDENTVMEWGSASKLLVWVSVMQLWEQGKLDLNADISEYLPEELCANRSFDAPVTMINLMNHNAGYQEVYADLFLKDADAVLPLEDALKAHAPAQIYEPGTVTAYSNWGCALAALIVQRVSGQDYAEYVHENIFEPLGMNDTALAADLSDNEAVLQKRMELQCYTPDGELIPDCFYYIPIYPAGMCTSTLGDFEKFGKALLNENSPLFQNSQNPETWQTLFTPTNYLGESGVPSNLHGFWALGYGVLTVGHGGNTAGCSSYLLLDLESKTGAVVMTNQAGESVYNTKMMSLIFGEFSAEKFFDGDQGEPSGIYSPARTYRKGPFKTLSLTFLDASMIEDELGGFRAASDGKLSTPYTDYLSVPTGRLILELALLMLWIAAVIFSFVRVLIIVIRKIVYKIKKNETKIAMNGWCLAASLAELTGFLLFAVMVSGVATFAPASAYTWASAAYIPLMLAMAALFVLGIIKMSRASLTKKQKACVIIMLTALVIAVANFVYWEFYMFWLI